MLTALFLDLRWEGDAHAVAVSAAGGELTVGDPVVDRVGRDPEPLGHLVDGHLIVAKERIAEGVGGRCAQLADRARVEWAAGAGAQAAGVELGGDLGVAVVLGEAPEQIERLRWRAPNDALVAG